MKKDTIVMPKKGDELYDGLLEIFKGKDGLWPWRFKPDWADESEKDEYCLNNGISEAERYLLDYSQYGELCLENKKGLPPISPGVYIMIWVLLKTQPDSGAEEDELAQRIYDKFNGRNFKYGEDHCRLFNMCVELVNRILSPDTAFAKAEESLRFAMNSVKNAQKKVRDLKGALKFERVINESQREQLKTLKGQIDYWEKMCEQLKEQKEDIQKFMVSKEHQQQIGERHLIKVFKEYLKGENRWKQDRRDKEYDRLERFLSLKSVPQEVKEMIEALAEDKEEGKGGVTVMAEAGATVNNYDIHGNNQVNTNKED